jgi:hypothetical protein
MALPLSQGEAANYRTTRLAAPGGFGAIAPRVPSGYNPPYKI